MRIHCINLRVGNECRGNNESSTFVYPGILYNFSACPAYHIQHYCRCKPVQNVCNSTVLESPHLPKKTQPQQLLNCFRDTQGVVPLCDRLGQGLILLLKLSEDTVPCMQEAGMFPAGLCV